MRAHLKLLRLVFHAPSSRPTATRPIIYTTYEMDLNTGGKTTTERGIATEVFVRRDGEWINTGWQLAKTGK
jgi:hypothetical protein